MEPPAEPPLAPEWKYWAFISYSHRDRRWADWLHAQLETYRIPKRLVGTVGRDATVPARVFPVFRDREELAGAASLGGEIEQALRQSRSLIVICSPDAAASRWVGEEIRSFKAMGRESRVLSLIVDGEPGGSLDADANTAECFPDALRFTVNADRAVTTVPAEPLAADVRPTGDGKRNAFLKLVAGVLDVPYDMLRQRDEERRRRRLLFVTAAATTLMVVFAGIAFYANVQRNEAERRGRIAQSRQLAANAANRLDRELDLALLLGVEATRAADTFEARSVLMTALNRHAVAFLNGFAVRVTCLVFSADDARLASGHADGTIVVWDSSARKPIRTLTAEKTIITAEGKPAILAIGFSVDGTRISVVTDEGSIQSWSLGSGEQKPSIEPVHVMTELFDAVTTAGFNRDGTRVAIGSEHGRILLWDMVAHQSLGQLGEQDALIEDVAFSDDDRLLVSGGVGNRVHLWDVAARKEVRTISTSEMFRVTAVAFNHEGTQVATGGLDAAMEMWQTSSGAPFGDLPRRTGHTDSINRIVFSPDDRSVATASSDRSVGMWSIYGTAPVRQLLGHQAETSEVTFSHDGRWLASAGRDGQIVLWDTSEAGPLGAPLAFNSDGIDDVVFRPDGQTIVVAKRNGIELFERSTRRPAQTDLFSPKVRLQKLVHDAKGMLLGLSQKDGGLVVWDFGRGAIRGAPRRGLFSYFNHIVYSARNDIVAVAGPGTSGSRGTVALWNAATGDMIGDTSVLSDQPVASFALTVDGTRLAAVTDDGKVAVRSVTARGLEDVPLHDVPSDLTVVVFTPDGEIVAAGSRNGTIAAWAVKSGARLPSLRPTQESVTALAFSPDGRMLASGSGFTIAFSDFAARAPLASAVSGHISGIRQVAFSSDGGAVLSLGGNQALLWDVDLASWQTRACRAANRDVSRMERERFMPDDPVAPCIRPPP